MTSTLSNDISSEANGPFKLKFHLWAGGLKVFFFFVFFFFMKILFLVWLPWQLQSFHRLIKGKIEKWHLLPSYCRYLDESFIEMFLE